MVKQTQEKIKENQERAEVYLKSIDEQLNELNDIIRRLKNDREEIYKLLDRQNPESPKSDKRQKPGLLIEVYLEALKENPEGLTSAEIKIWAKENRPEVLGKSLPSVLSKGVTDGRITKKGSRFLLDPKSPPQY